MADAVPPASQSIAIAAHAREVERYRAGEKKLFGVLLGAAMRATQGAAEPAVVRKMLEEKLTIPERTPARS